MALLSLNFWAYAAMEKINPTLKLRLIFLGTILLAHPLCAQVWKTNLPAPSAFMLAVSADGSKLASACGDGDVYVSTNSGGTWTNRTGLPNSTVIAGSADGNVLYVRAGNLNTSTDGGMTWHKVTNAPTYQAATGSQFISCSADGSHILTAIGNGQYSANTGSTPLFTSTNFGLTWATNNVITNSWQAGAVSADGSKAVAVLNNGGIFTSTNFGINWVSNTASGKRNWTDVAVSADGNTLIASASIAPGGIFTSTNFGTTWKSNSLPNVNWWAVAISANGQRLAAAGGGYLGSGPIYTSYDGGNSWTSNSAPVKPWSTIVMSADGQKFFASAYDGRAVWLANTNSPPPVLNVANMNGSLKISWPVPSTNYALLQSSDLSSWQNTTYASVLNFTNLNYEVVLPPTNIDGFFRLQTP
jgi:BNR-Asp box repeat/BNR/Asp-box repeat